MALPPPSESSTVVVTGASSGIGTVLARQLAGRGHHVTLVARRVDRLEALAEELGDATVRPCDLRDAGARDALIDDLAGGREVAGLCNNAGYGDHGPFHGADLDWNVGMVSLNCEALVHLSGAVLPGMVERARGAVLNVASLAAFQPLPNLATYAATKAFVHSFSQAVHEELRGTGVSVTSLCPGPVHTEFGERAGVRHIERGLPEIVYVDAERVVRHALRAMEAGRGTAVPTLRWKATALGGRFAPRSLLLPFASRVR